MSSDHKTLTLNYHDKTANIGMIGLGVMGQNLALNIERNGYSVAVFDREPASAREVHRGNQQANRLLIRVRPKSLFDRSNARAR